MNNHTRKLGGVLAPILTIFCFVSLFSCRAKQDCRGGSLTTVEVACDSFDVGCLEKVKLDFRTNVSLVSEDAAIVI